MVKLVQRLPLFEMITFLLSHMMPSVVGICFEAIKVATCTQLFICTIHFKNYLTESNYLVVSKNWMLLILANVGLLWNYCEWAAVKGNSADIISSWIRYRQKIHSYKFIWKEYFLFFNNNIYKFRSCLITIKNKYFSHRFSCMSPKEKFHDYYFLENP